MGATYSYVVIMQTENGAKFVDFEELWIGIKHIDQDFMTGRTTVDALNLKWSDEQMRKYIGKRFPPLQK